MKLYKRFLRSEKGITLLALGVTILMMIVIAYISLDAFDPQFLNDLEETEEMQNLYQEEQDREARNAIEGLGGRFVNNNLEY